MDLEADLGSDDRVKRINREDAVETENDLQGLVTHEAPACDAQGEEAARNLSMAN